MKTALIVDVSNLYFAINLAHEGKRLMLLDYTKSLEEQGHNLAFKIAYSRQSAVGAQNFTHMLNCHGFETHFGKGPWLVPIVLRTTELLRDIDCLVIGSNDEQLYSLFDYARKAGKKTKCFAVTIPTDMKKHAECFEVPESMMVANAPYQKAKPMVVPNNGSSDGTG